MTNDEKKVMIYQTASDYYARKEDFHDMKMIFAVALKAIDLEKTITNKDNFESQTEDLKPCPFCGGKAELTENRHYEGMNGSYLNWIIRCTNCGVKLERAADNFYGRESYTKEEVIEMWNARKNEDV